MASKTMTDADLRYTRSQLLQSEKYAGRRDLVGALLADGRSYTTDETDALIEKYLNGEVE